MMTENPIFSSPMVVSQGGAAPLCLYPPGFNLSGFSIFDPLSGEVADGENYVTIQATPLFESNILNSSTDETETGFYRVVRDGAHLFGVTNGMAFSGTVTIPVEVANYAGDLINLSLTEDGSPVVNSIQTAPFGSGLALTVDTTLMSNGVHQISASARWEDTNGVAWEADSTPITINVYNEISFPNWMPHFGQFANRLLIRATSAHTDADFYIDVYGSDYSYIGTFAGHTYDGNIDGVWNLVGPDGQVHTNDAFFICIIETFFNESSAMQPANFQASASGSASATTPLLIRITDPWFGGGTWVAAAQHAWDDFVDHDLLYSMLNGFVGAAKDNWQVNPSPFYGNYGWEAYPLHFGASDPQGTTDWAALRDALFTNFLSRNFVYFGHGGQNGIGYNPANTNRYITAAEIADKLNTAPNSTNLWHGFRFIFLDGCSTAKGPLPEAFGIDHKENISISDYLDAGMRPRAFVGWESDKAIGRIDPGGGLINYDHVNFITHIQQDMLLFDASIKEAIRYAARQPDVHDYYGSEAKGFKVYGCWDLTFGDYN